MIYKRYKKVKKKEPKSTFYPVRKTSRALGIASEFIRVKRVRGFLKKKVRKFKVK